MDNCFSQFQDRIIVLMLSKKPIEDIADILEKPFVEVRKRINELASLHQLKTFAEINKTFRKQIEQRENISRKFKPSGFKPNSPQPVFETKSIDYSQMISVRIDAKTIIWVKPGTDIQKAKENFLKAHNMNSNQETEKMWKKVANFK